MLIDAIKRANSVDPAKYLPLLQKAEFAGVTGRISFDAKGDRKDPEITIFSMKGGKLEPIAVVKSGQAMKFEDFIAQAKTGAAPAPADSSKGPESDKK
jgi:branched-chain amino acid transport system substrate-binding protein